MFSFFFFLFFFSKWQNWTFHVIVINQTPPWGQQRFWSRPYDRVLSPYCSYENNHFYNCVFHKRCVFTCLCFPQRHKIHHLFFLFTLTHIVLKCFFFFSHLCIIMLPSYDLLCYAQLLMMMLKSLYFLLSQRALRKKNFFLIMICCHVFLSIRLWSHFLFSFNCVPIKTTWEQEIMGNNIFLVLSFCGK